jgi:hypothetical protein
MGDYRITIEGFGNHGCARDATTGPDGLAQLRYVRCRRDNCPDCQAERFVQQLKARGENVTKATLEHWPVPGAGCGRTENPGPIDDLIELTRLGSFQTTPYIPVRTAQDPLGPPVLAGDGDAAPLPPTTPYPDAVPAAGNVEPDRPIGGQGFGIDPNAPTPPIATDQT